MKKTQTHFNWWAVGIAAFVCLFWYSVIVALLRMR